MSLAFTGATASDVYGKAQADGDDVRIVYGWDGYWEELPRDLPAFAADAITVTFPTRTPIAAGSADASYYLYYGNGSAGAASAWGQQASAGPSLALGSEQGKPSTSVATTATTYQYDGLSRLSTATFPGSLAVGYAYDRSGLRTRLILPDGKLITSTYDGAGRLENVVDWQSRTTTYAYDAGNRVTGITFPNATSASYAYDELNRTTYITNTSSVSGTLSALSYTYDKAGNRTAVTESIAGSGQGPTDHQFTYDSLYRLTEARTAAYTLTYQYDPTGNRTVLTDTGQVLNYTYDAADRMTGVGGNTVTWDANGNMLGKDGVSYAYDSSNRLTRVVSGTLVATYEYDADGLRTAATINGVRTSYLWDVNASLPVIISDTSSVYVNGLGLIARQSGLDVEYYHTDALGSVRNLTNGSGQAVGAYSYRPFGEPSLTIGTSSNRFRYTGQVNDPDAGLYCLRARYFEPSTGRFLSRDTISANPLKSQAWNKYAYVLNSPLNLVDPSGYDPLDAEWERQFRETHGRDPNDWDRQDRLFSIIFPGHGEGESWTDENWREYLTYRHSAWHPDEEDRQVRWTMPRTSDSFASHVERLLKWYADDEVDQFMKGFALIFAGIPCKDSAGALLSPADAMAAVSRNQELWQLHDGDSGWPRHLVDDAYPSHHYAAFVYVGYFGGEYTGIALNSAREILGIWANRLGSNRQRAWEDVWLGNIGAMHGREIAEDPATFRRLPSQIRALAYDRRD